MCIRVIHNVNCGSEPASGSVTQFTNHSLSTLYIMSNNTQTPDSKPIQRLFEMKGDNLSMYSKIKGDFSDLILVTSIDLLPTQTRSLDINQMCQGNLEEFPLEFRLGEMYYFLQIVPLFNPQNRTDYGLPSSSSLQEELP